MYALFWSCFYFHLFILHSLFFPFSCWFLFLVFVVLDSFLFMGKPRILLVSCVCKCVYFSCLVLFLLVCVCIYFIVRCYFIICFNFARKLQQSRETVAVTEVVKIESHESAAKMCKKKQKQKCTHERREKKNARQIFQMQQNEKQAGDI